jgi:hypothetical protein
MTPVEFAAWTSAAIAALAVVAVVVFGVLNLRQARRGSDGSPRWALESGPRGRLDLVNVGAADALDVHIKVDDAVGADGKTQFKVFSAGQRASFIVASGIGSPEPKVQVEYADRWGGATAGCLTFQGICSSPRGTCTERVGPRMVLIASSSW